MQDRKIIKTNFQNAPPYWQMHATVPQYCAGCGADVSAFYNARLENAIGLVCFDCGLALGHARVLLEYQGRADPKSYEHNFAVLGRALHPYLISKLADWALRAHNWPKMED